jgi:hypothetical protein
MKKRVPRSTQANRWKVSASLPVLAALISCSDAGSPNEVPFQPIRPLIVGQDDLLSEHFPQLLAHLTLSHSGTFSLPYPVHDASTGGMVTQAHYSLPSEDISVTAG